MTGVVNACGVTSRCTQCTILLQQSYTASWWSRHLGHVELGTRVGDWLHDIRARFDLRRRHSELLGQERTALTAMPTSMTGATDSCDGTGACHMHAARAGGGARRCSGRWTHLVQRRPQHRVEHLILLLLRGTPVGQSHSAYRVRYHLVRVHRTTQSATTAPRAPAHTSANRRTHARPLAIAARSARGGQRGRLFRL